jgi:hypothetical protein
MPTIMSETTFLMDEVAEALAHEAVFVSRNPQLLLRSDQHFIIFRSGEYRTSDPAEITFLLGVVKDEARGNRGVQVRSLPRTDLPALVAGVPTPLESPEARAAEPPASSPVVPPAVSRPSSRIRQSAGAKRSRKRG